MISAVVKWTNPQTKASEELGQFEFVTMPRVGELVGLPFEEVGMPMGFRVIAIYHFPTGGPPNYDAGESRVAIEVEWQH